MNNTIKIAKWELFRYIRSKAFILTLIIPFIIIIIAGVPQYLAMSSEQPVLNVGLLIKGTINSIRSKKKFQIRHKKKRKTIYFTTLYQC